MSFFSELKRRNVLRVGVLYILASWLILQITDVAVSLLELPAWSGKLVFLLVTLGFIPALLFSWLYELTPEGLKRDREVDRDQSITPSTGRKIDALIGIFGALAVITILADRLLPSNTPAPATQDASASSVPGTKAAAAIADDKSIAVLPFANMSGDESQEYFSDGISEELLNVLAQIPALRVAARTSSFQFKGQNSDIGEIGRTLGVAHVLEGSVRKAGDRLRITAQLIKADDGFHMWSNTYDREMIDIFAIQDEIARAVAGELQTRLGLDEPGQSEIRPQIIKAANSQAYEAYLQGRQLINKRGKDNLEEAVVHLERSLRLDSNFAPAHAQLAIATTLLLRGPSTYGDLSLAQVIDRVTPHIERAQALAPELAELHGARAILANVQSNSTEAVEHARKAVAINPSYIDARNWMVNALGSSGLYSESVPAREELYRLDPKSVIGRLNLVGIYFETDRTAEGYALAQELLKTHPWAGHVALSGAYIEADGEIAAGVMHGLQAFALEPEDQLGNSILAFGFGWIGLGQEARRINDNIAYEAYFSGGDYEQAVAAARNSIARDPENDEPVFQLAAALSRMGGHDAEALTLYEQLLERQPAMPALLDPLSNAAIPMARLAWYRARTNDTAGASEAVAAIQAELAERRKAGLQDYSAPVVEAMLAAQRKNAAAASTALRLAVERGWRDRGVFDEPMFAELKGKPDFVAIRQNIEAILGDERKKTLQIICHENPVPDAWQPLPETCDGAR